MLVAVNRENLRFEVQASDAHGHARARFCPPARLKSNARLAHCPKNLNGQMPVLPVATLPMPGQPAGKNGHYIR